jgi:hypothetical protein
LSDSLRCREPIKLGKWSLYLHAGSIAYKKTKI